MGLGRHPPQAERARSRASIKKRFSGRQTKRGVSLVGVPPFGGAGFNREKDETGGRYAEPWVPVQEGRERQACLARPWKLRRAGGYRPGGFHIGNLMINGDRWFFKGEIFDPEYGYGYEQWLRGLCRRVGKFEPEIGALANSPDSLISMVAAGRGVFVGPKFLSVAGLQRLTFIR